ncbi:PREDICTED: centromere protein C-like [Chrysochloris asiatica]|uniref:Centromere protein C n=1 Tax=Chrysochloris asiatica TaxID=185453 RepID=A0A9B0U0Q4_CHRAS|nr:PREDICTED: centromere protein C-like [Chrysochloris asiatica]
MQFHVQLEKYVCIEDTCFGNIPDGSSRYYVSNYELLNGLVLGYTAGAARAANRLIPDINVEQGQNILEILHNCFEEKSSVNDFNTDSTTSESSTPKIKAAFIQSPSKECQKSHAESLPVSSKKKKDCLRLIEEPNEDVNQAVQAHEIHQKILTTDVDFENTDDLEVVSNRKQNDHQNEAQEEFYLSVGPSSVVLDAETSLSQNAVLSIAQKSDAYTLENSVNMPSSSKEISFKTKKRLNFEGKNVLKKIEIEDKVSEGPQKRRPSGASQKRTQDSEYEIQPQAKKRFSTLFLETVKRKTESSSVVRHGPLHSSPNDVMLLEDEFVIGESEKSFGARSWLKIPRKANSPKQCTVSPIESSVVLQGRKSRKKHDNVMDETLTSDKSSHKGHLVEKSQLIERKKLDTFCASEDEMENYKSIKDAVYSEKAEKSSGNKRIIKQKQRRRVKTNVVEKQLDVEQPTDKNINMSLTAQHKLQKNSDKDMEVCEEMRNDHISKKQMTHMGQKKGKAHVPNKESQKKVKEKFMNKCISSGPQKKKVVSEEVTVTITKSRRISRRPSNWWEVTSEQSPVCSSSSLRINELSVHQKSRQKPAEKTRQSSKNIMGETALSKQQKTATQDNSRAKKFLNAEDSGGIVENDKITSSQNESLESDTADLAKKKNLDHSGDYQKNKPILEEVHPESCFEAMMEKLRLCGPSKIQKYVSGKNNTDVGRKKAQKSSDDSRVKRSKVIAEKKIHHKLVLPSNSPDVRRSKRIRLKPLEYWRGERIDYTTRLSGGFVVGGILSPDRVSPKRKTTNGNRGKVSKITNREKRCLDKNERKNSLVANLDVPLGDPFQPTRVKDPETDECILRDLIRPRDTCKFFVDHKELRVYKTLDTPFFSTGKLILGPCQEKGMQYVGVDILVFYVEFGDLLCTLHETPYLITTGDSFYVPSGNYYNIINLLNEECVLLFTQIKR